MSREPGSAAAGGERSEPDVEPAFVADSDDDPTVIIARDDVDDDATVIVPRGDEGDDSTVRVSPGEGEADDSTISLPPRTPRTAAEPGGESPQAADDDSTVLIPGRRSAADADSAPDDADESTIVVRRASQSAPVDTARSADSTHAPDGVSALVRPTISSPRLRRRGALRPAPVPSGFGGMPIVGAGAGTVSSYGTRVLPAPPPAPAMRENVVPVRIVGGVTSVGRRSRTASLVVFGTTAVAFVLLTGTVVWSVRWLLGS